MKKERIKHVTLQAAASAPGVLAADLTLDPNSKHKGMEIFLIDNTILDLYYKDIRIGIPITNAKSWVYAEDESIPKIPKSQKN
jgi:hypothetical protein